MYAISVIYLCGHLEKQLRGTPLFSVCNLLLRQYTTVTVSPSANFGHRDSRSRNREFWKLTALIQRVRVEIPQTRSLQGAHGLKMLPRVVRMYTEKNYTRHRPHAADFMVHASEHISWSSNSLHILHG